MNLILLKFIIDRALKEIEKGKGNLLDSRIVDACVNLFKNKKFKL